MSTTYAVIGGSRGIGLEYVKQLSARPDTTVFAVVRSIQGSTLLTSFAKTAKNVHAIEADAADHASLLRAAKEIGKISGGKLDVLIHNAARTTKDLLYRGPADYTSMEELSEDWIDAFKVNTLGVVYSFDAFLPLLRAGRAKKIVVIGTDGASYAAVRKGGVSAMVAYSVTKASATAATVKYALLLRPEGFTTITLSPGLVETDATTVLSTDNEPTKARIVDLSRAVGYSGQTPEESVLRQLKVIDAVTPADSGKFLTRLGTEFE